MRGWPKIILYFCTVSLETFKKTTAETDCRQTRNRRLDDAVAFRWENDQPGQSKQSSENLTQFKSSKLKSLDSK